MLRKEDEPMVSVEVDENGEPLPFVTYHVDRFNAYPPITDYLDGIVKGDQAQIDKYISDCRAVKEKYPKGS